MMRGRLLLVVGPSGAGKDSVIAWVRERLARDGGGTVCFARRTITRELKPGGEQHLAVSAEQFAALRTTDQFALCWHANGCSYGIGVEIVDWLDSGLTVVVNGSRQNVPDALARFPFAEVVVIRASEATLRERLTARARESAAQIEERIRRAASVTVPGGVEVAQIWNDGELARAGQALLDLLLAGPDAAVRTRGAPAPVSEAAQ